MPKPTRTLERISLPGGWYFEAVGNKYHLQHDRWGSTTVRSGLWCDGDAESFASAMNGQHYGTSRITDPVFQTAQKELNRIHATQVAALQSPASKIPVVTINGISSSMPDTEYSRYSFPDGVSHEAGADYFTLPRFVMAEILELRELKRKLQSPAGEWRPIATAPKDGRKLLLWPTDGSHHRNCEPQSTIGYWTEHAPGTKYAGKGFWMGWNKCKNPTHWLPLPPAPTQKKDK